MSPLIRRANQWTGFGMLDTSFMKEFKYLISKRAKCREEMFYISMYCLFVSFCIVWLIACVTLRFLSISNVLIFVIIKLRSGKVVFSETCIKPSRTSMMVLFWGN